MCMCTCGETRWQIWVTFSISSLLQFWRQSLFLDMVLHRMDDLKILRIFLGHWCYRYLISCMTCLDECWWPSLVLQPIAREQTSTAPAYGCPFCLQALHSRVGLGLVCLFLREKTKIEFEAIPHHTVWPRVSGLISLRCFRLTTFEKGISSCKTLC